MPTRLFNIEFLIFIAPLYYILSLLTMVSLIQVEIPSTYTILNQVLLMSFIQKSKHLNKEVIFCYIVFMKVSFKKYAAFKKQ